MLVDLKKITVKELVEGYEDNNEGGVTGYKSRLDIRPKYQREFIYKDKQREAVIDTVIKGFPLNVMYWADREDDTYEVIDGQQRTISIAQYVNSDFSFNEKYFHNLQDDEQKQILDYELMIYICSGTDSEKLEWFKTINIAGEELTNQELRNAVYSGSWVTDAKRYFSKTGCPAYQIGNKLLTGTPIRQDYLETVLKWFSKNNIEDFMATNQNTENANEIWLYFQKVVNWTNIVFTKYRNEMKGIDWGSLYNEFKSESFDSVKLEEEIAGLMEDEDVTKKKGIYQYVLTRKEKYLNIRSFSANQKREAYERQNGICPADGKHYKIDEMEADHIKPWHLGGKTISENCQMLSKEANRAKSGK